MILLKVQKCAQDRGGKEFVHITSVLNHPDEKKCRREHDLFDSQLQVKIYHWRAVKEAGTEVTVTSTI